MNAWLLYHYKRQKNKKGTADQENRRVSFGCPLLIVAHAQVQTSNLVLFAWFPKGWKVLVEDVKKYPWHDGENGEYKPTNHNLHT